MSRLVAKKNLKLIRSEKFTQKEIVDLFAIEFKRPYDRSWFGKVENGRRTIGVQEGVFLARLFKMDLNELFDSKEEDHGSGD